MWICPPAPRSHPSASGRIHAALCPGGLFVFDVAEPRQSAPKKYYRLGEDWAVLRHAEEDRKRNIQTRRITSFRKLGKYYRRSEEIHRLRLYRGSALRTALTRIGFRVRPQSVYGRFRLPSAHVALVAQKITKSPNR